MSSFWDTVARIEDKLGDPKLAACLAKLHVRGNFDLPQTYHLAQHAAKHAKNALKKAQADVLEQGALSLRLDTAVSFIELLIAGETP